MFRKLVDVIKEKELSNSTYKVTDSPNTDITVRKLFSKFKKSSIPEVESVLSKRRSEFSEKESYSFENEAFEENFKKPRNSFSDIAQDFSSDFSFAKSYFSHSKEFLSSETSKNSIKRNELKRLETIRSESYEERNTQASETKTFSKQEQHPELQEIQKSIDTLNFNIQIIMKKLDFLAPSSSLSNNIIPLLSTHSPINSTHSTTTKNPLVKQASEESSNKFFHESKLEVKHIQKQNSTEKKKTSSNKKSTKTTKNPKSVVHNSDAHFLKSKNSKTLSKNKSLNMKEYFSALASKSSTNRTGPTISTNPPDFKKQNSPLINNDKTHNKDENAVDNNFDKNNRDLLESQPGDDVKGRDGGG